MKAAILLAAGVFFMSFVPQATRARDPGQPDSLLIGCLDSLSRDPICVSLGQRVAVPVWWKTDDSVTFFHIPVGSDNRYVIAREGGAIYEPFSLFDDISFLPPDTNSPEVGYTSQSLLGFAYLGEKLDDPRRLIFPIILSYGWVHACDFIMTITSDTAAIGDTTFLMEGRNPANGGLLFGLEDGMTGFVPATYWGRLRIVTNVPGDANSSGGVDGLDVVFLVNYLKGVGPSPDPLRSGDANGDCLINGMDVVYLVNYLKGIGPAPVPSNCP